MTTLLDQSLKNQQEFRELLDKHGLTQAQAAELITQETERPVSTRTVKTWLASATARTAQPCPNWALKALKRTLQEKTA
jgi:putative heme degradation protein